MPVRGPDWSFFGIGTFSNIVAGIWALALLASFAGLLIAGMVFAFSGDNPQRRDSAMGWIRNVALAILVLGAAGALWGLLYALGQAAS